MDINIHLSYQNVMLLRRNNFYLIGFVELLAEMRRIFMTVSKYPTCDNMLCKDVNPEKTS